MLIIIIFLLKLVAYAALARAHGWLYLVLLLVSIAEIAHKYAPHILDWILITFQLPI